MTEKRREHRKKKGARRLEATTAVALEKLEPNPYQPAARAKVDEKTAELFGLSILEHGLIQAPVCRRNGDYYEIGDGYLRLAGYRWLVANGHVEGFSAMPVVVRDLTDQQMADLVMEANTVRQDLNPIELATLYKQYLEDFGITQEQLAEKHSCTQGMVANTIRLLELPADIQKLIISREISPGHARQLLRANKAPQLLKELMTGCTRQNQSVSQLANEVESTLWHRSKSLNPKADGWERPAFDISECKDCEHKVKASQPYGSKKKEDRCLNEQCWGEKNAAAVQEQIKEAEKKQEGGEKVLTDSQVGYNQRETIHPDDIDSPEECKKCPKAALFKYRATDSGKPERICLEPSCYRKKKSKKTRDTNKANKELDRELTVKVGQVLQHAHDNPRGCLLVLAKHILPRLDADGRQDLALMFVGLPKLSNGRLDMDAVIAGLNDKTLEELLDITTAARFTISRRAAAYREYSVSLKHDQQRDLAAVAGTMDEFVAEVTTFQEANCRGCSRANEARIGTGEECCTFTYHKKLNDEGTCEGRLGRAGSTDEPEPEEEEVEAAE